MKVRPPHIWRFFGALLIAIGGGLILSDCQSGNLGDADYEKGKLIAFFMGIFLVGLSLVFNNFGKREVD